MPIPDKKDVKRFCAVDGTVLRTKVSLGRGPICHAPGLWTKVWRHQLGLNSEDEFWEVLKTRKPAKRGAPAAAPPEPQMPAWLFEALVYTFGVDESEVRSLNEDEALARYLALCEGGETPA